MSRSEVAPVLLDGLIDAIDAPVRLTADGLTADGLLALHDAVAVLDEEDLRAVTLAIIARLADYAASLPPLPEGEDPPAWGPGWAALVALAAELDPDDPAGVRDALAEREEEELRGIVLGTLGIVAEGRGAG